MRKLQFYFDFISPYAYFASKRIEAFCEEHDLELEWKPIPLGIILRHWGNKGPAEIPPKREHTFRDCLRYAAANELPFTMPRQHPFNPITALRCAVEDSEVQAQIIRAIFDAGWRDGRDLGDPQQLQLALELAGLDGAQIVEQTQNPDIKSHLKQHCDEALQHGVFGVPTFVIDGHLFWGNDQFETIAPWLTEGDPFDDETLTRLLHTPSAFNE